LSAHRALRVLLKENIYEASPRYMMNQKVHHSQHQRCVPESQKKKNRSVLKSVVFNEI